MNSDCAHRVLGRQARSALSRSRLGPIRLVFLALTDGKKNQQTLSFSELGNGGGSSAAPPVDLQLSSTTEI